MYGGDIGGAGGGSNWKAPDDPSLVVGGKDDVSINFIFYKQWQQIHFKRIDYYMTL